MKIIDNLEKEKALYEKGYTLIGGIDEVGRGPLAGPVVATCVIMPKGFYVEGITDSKKLSIKKREEFNKIILENAISVSTIFISEEKIDEINIYEATKLAMINAIKGLSVKPDYILIDAMPLDIDIPHESIIKGDELSFSIACASIVSKVARDHLMDEYALIYPEYGFEKNKGYGTKTHIEALKKYGPTKIHRKTYAPIKQMISHAKQLNFSLFDNLEENKN